MAKTLNPKTRSALIQRGKEILFPFLDVSEWKAEVDVHDDGFTASIKFTNANKKSVVISEIWFDEENGQMIQWGSNYGDLVL